jgi:hypothetical protein
VVIPSFADRCISSMKVRKIRIDKFAPAAYRLVGHPSLQRPLASVLRVNRVGGELSHLFLDSGARLAECEGFRETETILAIEFS